MTCSRSMTPWTPITCGPHADQNSFLQCTARPGQSDQNLRQWSCPLAPSWSFVAQGLTLHFGDCPAVADLNFNFNSIRNLSRTLHCFSTFIITCRSSLWWIPCMQLFRTDKTDELTNSINYCRSYLGPNIYIYI